MNDLDRRGFLKGVFGGVTAAGVIMAASAAEIEAFASPLGREASLVVDVPKPTPARVEAGTHLYNAQGELVAIVTGISTSAPAVANRVQASVGIQLHAEVVGAITLPWHGVVRVG